MLAFCAFTKVLLVTERHGAVPLASLGAWLQRDVAVAAVWALSVAVAARWRPTRGAAQVALVLAAAYVGVNVGFFRSFSTPLNRGLFQMAGAPSELRDSAVGLVTLANLLPVGVCVALALAVPPLLGRVRPRVGATLAVLPVPLLLLGLATPTIEPRGLDRNALWEAALLAVPETRPVLAEHAARPVPRGSIAEPGARRPDLSHLRGAGRDLDVVLVLLESTAAAYLGPWGAEPDPMPTVSRLAEHALVFDAWYSVTPTSTKSIFSLLCSTWPYPRPAPETQVAPRLPCHSLPERMAASGRRSMLVHSGRFAYTDKHLFLEGRGYESLWDAETLGDEHAWRDGWGIEEEAAVARVERFLDDLAPEERFFLTYIPIFPHHPYKVPAGVERRFGARTGFDRYRSAMAYADTALAAVVDAVAAHGRLDRTLFVLVGDHGEAFRQHPGNVIHSIEVYEENVHVPALIANPRLFQRTVRSDAPADHTSLAPTLLDLLGLEAPDRWQGQSLLDGERDVARFFTDYAFLKLGLRDGRYKFIHAPEGGTAELYDLEADPGERANLVAQEPLLAERYRAHLEHWYHRQLAIFEDYGAYLGGRLGTSGVALEHLVPVHVEQGWGEVRAGRSVADKPLRVAGEAFASGLGTHASGVVRYALDGSWVLLEGAVGRDEAALDGVVEAEIWVDGERAFASGPLARDTRAKRFRVPLVGAGVLELRALPGDGATRGDHVDWVDVRLR